ncbi:hypothetical protein GJ496_011534 [Pomphorhynchus laevis]|nr:hypothetical protein GJ496_011534 [Pomphorhynchus laevis]
MILHRRHIFQCNRKFLRLVLTKSFFNENLYDRAKHNWSVYTSLSKHRLSGFVALSALTGYLLAPGSHTIINGAFLTSGTFLMACGANSLNQ